MKKLIIFLVCAVLLIGVVRVVSLRYQDKPEDFTKIQEWIDWGKGKAKEVTAHISAQIAGQEWEVEGNYDIDTENWFDSEGTIYSGNLEYTKLSTGEVKHFTVQAAGCKVIIKVTEVSDFYFSFENIKKVQAYQKENTLLVKAVRSSRLNEEDKENILTIHIPEECLLESANLELGAGSMQVEKLNTQKLELTVEAGKFMMDSVEAGDMEISLGAGVISLENVSVQNAEISVGAGSMSMAGRITGNVDADCAMGSLEINVLGNVKDFNYKLQCMAGNILLNGEKYSGINEGMLIGNAATKDMELDCTVGSMKITFEE